MIEASDTQDEQWYVDVIKYDGDQRVKRLGPYSTERMADKADRGVSINLNHDEYWTKVYEQGEQG